jgi:uncharacterized protein (UPF0335 family)
MDLNVALKDNQTGDKGISARMKHALDEMADGKHGDEEIVEAEIINQVGPVLSLVAVKPQFKHFTEKVEKMVADAQTIEITDEDRLKFAVALGGEAKKITKAIDAKKKDVTAEASDFVKSVNGFCKLFTDKLADVEIGLKKKISAYQTKLELERRKQEQLAQKAAESLQEQINKEAEKAGVEAPIVQVPVIPKQETVTRTETGTSSYQVKRWICTVTDPAVVPRQFCEPSKKLLDDAVKQGLHEIAGCKIEEVSETRFRT